MTEHSLFLDYLGDTPRMRVLQYLIEGRHFEYTLTDMLNAGVSWGTINSLIPKFSKLGIVTKQRKIGRATLYKINKDNDFVKQLITFYNKMVLEHLETLAPRIPQTK